MDKFKERIMKELQLIKDSIAAYTERRILEAEAMAAKHSALEKFREIVQPTLMTAFDKAGYMWLYTDVHDDLITGDRTLTIQLTPTKPPEGSKLN